MYVSKLLTVTRECRSRGWSHMPTHHAHSGSIFGNYENLNVVRICSYTWSSSSSKPLYLQRVILSIWKVSGDYQRKL